MGHLQTVPFFDLKAQTEQIRREVIEAIEGTIDSSMFVLGPSLEQFENSFSKYCGCSHAIGVSSGTAALHVALVALGVGPGDEVITAPNTFVATIEAILHAGARPILADVREDTFCIDPKSVESAITAKTKAIIPIHLFGQPSDMDALCSLAEQHSLFILEDACQAHGAVYKGKRAGSLGHAAAFSFYPSKNLGAFGDGGAVTTNDADIAGRITALRHHAQFEKNQHSTIGYNYRLDCIQAAVLNVKLRYLDKWNDRRREIAQRYISGLAGMDYKLQAVIPDVVSSYHIMAAGHPNSELVQDTLDENNIGWGKHFAVPVHLQPGYRFLGYDEGSFPVSERLAEQLISLPLYPEMTDAQVDYVVDILTKVNVPI
jgi:dTDP-4-amino-4,6-dideoxygalactose transaminase